MTPEAVGSRATAVRKVTATLRLLRAAGYGTSANFSNARILSITVGCE
jgi:hypothetical protein